MTIAPEQLEALERLAHRTQTTGERLRADLARGRPHTQPEQDVVLALDKFLRASTLLENIAAGVRT